MERETLDETTKISLARGRQSWQETKLARTAAQERTWNEFHDVLKTDLGRRLQYVDLAGLRATWEFHRSPAIGTKKIIILRVPDLAPISVIYEVIKDHPTLLGKWKRGRFDTFDLGLQPYLINRLGFGLFYAETWEIALGAAEEAQQEAKEIEAAYVAEINTKKTIIQLPKTPPALALLKSDTPSVEIGSN